MAAIDNKIRQFRAQHSMTQEDLARAVGVTRQTIIAVEQNKYVPSLRLALKISKTFDQPIEQIFMYQ